MQKHVCARGRIAVGAMVSMCTAMVVPGTTTLVPEQNLIKLDKIATLAPLRYLVNHRKTCDSLESKGMHFKLDNILGAVGWQR